MIQDKIAFVSGASAGIGRATALAFDAAGARVIAAARRKERLEELPERIYRLELDVCDLQGIEGKLAQLPAELQEIDVLVNNAGLSRRLDKLSEGEISDWQQMIDTNVSGLLALTRAVLPGMMERESGQIINIGSIAGHEVYPGGAVYCATKHAVRAINKTLLHELAETPIRVCSIDPGAVETEFSVVRFDGDKTRAQKVYEGFDPLRAEDIAEAVLWVANRPAHVQVAEMLVLASAQAGATKIHRKDNG